MLTLGSANKILFLLLPLLISAAAISVSYGQEGACERMYREAIELAKDGNYRLALNKLNAAKICNPRDSKYDRLIVAIYDSINLQKVIATTARQTAEIALQREKEARRLSEKRLASLLYKSAVYDFADQGNFIKSYVLLAQAAAKDPADTSIHNMLSQILPLLSDTIISNIAFTKKINWGSNSYQLLVEKVPKKSFFEFAQRLPSGVQLSSGMHYINEAEDPNDKYQLKIGSSKNDKFTVTDFDTITCTSRRFWAYTSRNKLIIFADNDLWAYSWRGGSTKPTLDYHLEHNLSHFASGSQVYYNTGTERQTFITQTQLRLMDHGFAIVFVDQRLTIVSLESLGAVIDFGVPEKDHYTDILNIRFLPPGQLVVQYTIRTAPQDGRWTETDPSVNVYTLPSGKLLHHFEGYQFDDPFGGRIFAVAGMPEIDASEAAGIIGLAQSRRRSGANGKHDLSDSNCLLYRSLTGETLLLGKAFEQLDTATLLNWKFTATDKYILLWVSEGVGREKLLIFDQHLSFLKELNDVGSYRFFKGSACVVYQSLVRNIGASNAGREPNPSPNSVPAHKDTLNFYLIENDSLFYVASENFLENMRDEDGLRERKIMPLKNGQQWGAYDPDFSFLTPVLLLTEEEARHCESKQLNANFIWVSTSAYRKETLNGRGTESNPRITNHNYFYSIKEHKILFQNDDDIYFNESVNNCLYYTRGRDKSTTIYRLNLATQRTDSVSGPEGFLEPVRNLMLYNDLILISPSRFYALQTLTRSENTVYPGWIKDILFVYNNATKKMDTLFLPLEFDTYEAPFKRAIDSASYASFIKSEHLLGNFLTLYGVSGLQRTGADNAFADPSNKSLFYAINLNFKGSRQQYYRKKFGRLIERL